MGYPTTKDGPVARPRGSVPGKPGGQSKCSSPVAEAATTTTTAKKAATDALPLVAGRGWHVDSAVRAASEDGSEASPGAMMAGRERDQ